MKPVLIVLSFFLASQYVTASVFFCYWGSWSYYRSGDGKFSVEQIDPNMCTHIVYSFAKLDNGVIAASDAYLDLTDDSGLGMYSKLNDLKTVNPKLKTLIAIGGWNEGSLKYSSMASTPEGRKKFVDSVVLFLEKHGFDGLDVDWEYPANRGGATQDKANFALLLSELRGALDSKSRMLTAAVSAGQATIDTAYDVPGLSKYLHFINLMTYDFFGSWNPYTGHNSPLKARQNAPETEEMLNVESSVKYWIAKGADPRKLTLGLPLYGRTFVLADPANDGFGAPTTGPGPAGPITQQPGSLGYNEICTMLGAGGWKITRDPNVVAPVAVKDKLWIGYDDVGSLKAKVNFAQTLGLGGVMTWSIETDDFNGKCHGTKNPLLTAIHGALAGGEVTVKPIVTSKPSSVSSTQVSKTTTTTSKSQITSTTTTTKAPSSSTEWKCPGEGFYANPKDKTKFYRCVLNATGGFDAISFDCPLGTVFNEEYDVCTFP
ncbi:chitinase-3-like protein 2 [Ornithodoros turicata]|uniref:chitinase-3-like protein 2 n=1 Tax=Ornithodoros turicata TaxID=34597 RepID=UPI0031387109